MEKSNYCDNCSNPEQLCSCRLDKTQFSSVCNIWLRLLKNPVHYHAYRVFRQPSKWQNLRERERRLLHAPHRPDYISSRSVVRLPMHYIRRFFVRSVSLVALVLYSATALCSASLGLLTHVRRMSFSSIVISVFFYLRLVIESSGFMWKSLSSYFMSFGSRRSPPLPLSRSSASFYCSSWMASRMIATVLI